MRAKPSGGRIGKAAAIQLAQCGATVIMACRSTERGARALAEVREAAHSQDMELIQVDMASQTSIHKFVDSFLARHSRLDVLIHNAANFDHTLKQPQLIIDGVETIFATNHVGIFLMTHPLLDTLKASPPSRIVTVASNGLLTYPFLDIEFDNLNGERKFCTQHAYYQSKQSQVMFTYDLAQRLKCSGVTVNCVRVTNVALPVERLERQAGTYVYLTADAGVQEITGGYWDENNRQVRSNAKSYNQDTWKKLWEVSEHLAGI